MLVKIVELFALRRAAHATLKLWKMRLYRQQNAKRWSRGSLDQSKLQPKVEEQVPVVRILRVDCPEQRFQVQQLAQLQHHLKVAPTFALAAVVQHFLIRFEHRSI